MQIVVALALIALVFVAGPLLLIWSLNTLFGLGIGYSLSTFGAALFLLLVANGGVKNE